MEPNTNNPAPVENTPQTHGMGALVGTLIVLAVLILGGVYFLSSQTQQPNTEPPVILGDEPQNSVPVAQPISSSDAVNDISADAEATDMADLEAQIDADLRSIESNL